MISIQQRSLDPKTFHLNPAFRDLDRLSKYIREYGCLGCELGQQKTIVGPVLYRGNPTAEIMCCGECPGKIEDKLGKVFSGPAGEKGDEIFKYIGIDTNEDCYMCNIVNCRYCAPYKSGKENLTPIKQHIESCFPYFIYQFSVVKPKILITLGMCSFKTLFPEKAKEQKVMLNIAGTPFYSEKFNIPVMPLYHPAVILHSTKDPERNLFYRKAMLTHILTLKSILDNNYNL